MNMDMTEPWDLADVIFVIEGKKVYVNKTILTMSADVFRTMFTADFKEKDLAEIPLPGKNFDSFLMLMKVIHPPNMEVNGSNVQQLLPLAHEYGVHHVTSCCEKVLLTEPPSVKLLVLAARYSLPQLYKTCLDYTQLTPLTHLEAQPGFDQLQQDTIIQVLRHKVLHTELEQEPEDAAREQQQEAEQAECVSGKPSREFIYELMSKPPSVGNLLLGEKYNIPPVIQTCVNYLKDKPLSELAPEPGYDKITPVTLVQILNHKVIDMEPKVQKLERLEKELKSAASNLTQIASLVKGGKQSQTVCRKLKEEDNPLHTAGFRYGHTRYVDCNACKLSVLQDIANLCVPGLQRLSNIK